MKILDARFAEAAAVTDPKLVEAAVVYHRASARTKISCYLKYEKFRQIVESLTEAKLI